MEHDPLAPMRKEVEDAVGGTLRELGLDAIFRLGRPREAHGDLSLPCHPFAKDAKKKPEEVAAGLAAALRGRGGPHAYSSDAGFLNIAFQPGRLARETLKTALTLGEKYGSHPSSGKRVLVEHTSANPTGPLHVGRARNPIIGDSLARLLRAAGAKVETEFYVNDVGKQVAALTWGCLNLPGGGDSTSEIVKRYQEASELLKSKEERATREITELLQRLEKGEVEACADVERFTSIVLREMGRELEALDIRFDRFTHESSFIKRGRVRELFDELAQRGVVKQDGTALYMELEGDEERFYLTRSDGTSLYSSRDIAYHDDKLRRADGCINVLGEDQKHAFRQLSTALRALGLAADGGKSLEALFYGIVNLPGEETGTTKKMSTRAGTAVALRGLVEEARRRAAAEVRKRRADIGDEAVDSISSAIAVGAVRYNIVRIQPEKSIVFRWEEALSFEGDAAPFIQYAHARCMSVFRRAKEEKGWSFPGDLPSEPAFDPAHLDMGHELPLLRSIAWLPATVVEAAGRMAPHVIAGAAFELADRLMKYYEHVHFLGSEHWRERLEVVAATKYAVASAMGILGIPALEEM